MHLDRSRIYLSAPHMGSLELEYVKEAFAANWISPVGPHIQAFEEQLAAYNKIDHCAVLSSGTAAIHLALILLGVERGDEVICSTFTFSGSCNPIAYQGATPVFVDSEKETWNMDPSLLEEAIEQRMKKTGRKPKAIVVVHLYGMPARIKALVAIARQYDIPVIEDAAEALGSMVDGQKLGTFGDLGVYSFNGNKIITTSGGGALVSNRADWIQKARFLATQARDPAPHYEHSHIGYNYRMSNICAGIGRGQLQVLPERIAARRRNFAYYRQRLGGGVFSFPEEPAGYYSNRWLTTALIDSQARFDREHLRQHLEKWNIETRPLWKPMHLQPVFAHAPHYTSGVSEDLFRCGICLPSGSQMDEATLADVCHHIEVVTSTG